MQTRQTRSLDSAVGKHVAFTEHHTDSVGHLGDSVQETLRVKTRY